MGFLKLARPERTSPRLTERDRFRLLMGHKITFGCCSVSTKRDNFILTKPGQTRVLRVDQTDVERLDAYWRELTAGEEESVDG